jgi:hypothetical protein
MYISFSLGNLNKLKTHKENLDFLTFSYPYQGNGRAFCAGGDVAAVARDSRGGMFSSLLWLTAILY